MVLSFQYEKKNPYNITNPTKRKTQGIHTRSVKGFGHGYFGYLSSVLQQRHIRVR